MRPRGALGAPCCCCCSLLLSVRCLPLQSVTSRARRRSPPALPPQRCGAVAGYASLLQEKPTASLCNSAFLKLADVFERTPDNLLRRVGACAHPRPAPPPSRSRSPLPFLRAPARLHALYVRLPLPCPSLPPHCSLAPIPRAMGGHAFLCLSPLAARTRAGLWWSTRGEASLTSPLSKIRWPSATIDRSWNRTTSSRTSSQ